MCSLELYNKGLRRRKINVFYLFYPLHIQKCATEKQFLVFSIKRTNDERNLAL